MRAPTVFVAVLAALVAPALAAAACGDAPGDVAAVDAPRALVATLCDCAGAPSHGAYVSCVAAVANLRVGAGLLPASCKGAVKRCASKSTCGRPGAVTCCRTRQGVTKCKIKRAADRCTAPSGGSACVGLFTSCCDACTAGGCAAAPTTSSTTSTTTTTSTSSSTSLPYEQCGTPFVCGGPCPSGTTCGPFGIADPVQFYCACLPDDPVVCGSAGAAPFPTCGGVCPGTRECRPFVDYPTQGGEPLEVCLCVEPTSPCGFSGPGSECGAGACAPGQACASAPQTPGGPFCGCITP